MVNKNNYRQQTMSSPHTDYMASSLSAQPWTETALVIDLVAKNCCINITYESLYTLPLTPAPCLSLFTDTQFTMTQVWLWQCYSSKHWKG